jgi:putative polymerase
MSIETIAAAIVCVAVCFNMVLAFLNLNLTGIGRGDVILAEIVIVCLALMVCVISANRLMLPWVGVVWLLVTIFICLSLMRQSVDLKYFRDVLLIPVFAALGMTFAKGNIVKLFCILQTVILGVMIFEGLAPGTYSRVFSPWEYYVSTRWSDYEPPWRPELGLYLSSFRPGGRIFFETLGLHRLSSIFLEPVSLGNWSIIVTIFVTAFWRMLPIKALLFLILSNMILLIGCDGRLALITSMIIVVLSVFVHNLPRYSYVVYLPGVIVIAAVLVAGFALDSIHEGYSGRIAFSVSVLANMDLSSLLGIDKSLIAISADSGVSYFILTQSIFGATALWISICLLQPPNSRCALVLMHGICVYLALALIISYSVFSIKTAAPIWFLYGYVRARGFLEGRMTCPPETQAT